MSRRHLTLALVALTSLAITACSSSPVAPQSRIEAGSGVRADSLGTAVTDSVHRSGWSGSST